MRSWSSQDCGVRFVARSNRLTVPLLLMTSLGVVQNAYGDELQVSVPAVDAPSTAQATPVAATGTLVVIGTGAEPATLSVDGKDVGPLPFTGELPAGTHDVVARSAHGISATRKVVVSANGRTEIELRVVENPSKLRVTTSVPGAIIRVDGIPYATRRFDGEVAAGKHTISVEQQGYIPSVVDVDLKPDEQKVLENVVLERATPAPFRAPRSKQGMYTIVAVDGLLARPTNSFELDCPDSLGRRCSSSVNMGGQLDVHVGYSFGIFGIEGFAIGGTNLSIAKQEFPTDVSRAESPDTGIARKERYLIFEPIFGGGAAARVSTQGKTYRLSTALGFGVAWRSVTVNRRVEAIEGAGTPSILRKDGVTLTPSGGDRAVPLLVWDSDIQLGDTPGTRIFLGIHGQLELGSEPTVNLGSGSLGYVATTGEHLPLGGGSMTPRRSPAIFFGPRLGIITGF